MSVRLLAGSKANINTAFWTLAWWTVISRVDLELVFPAISSRSLKVLPRHLIGQGSAVSNCQLTRNIAPLSGCKIDPLRYRLGWPEAA